MRSDVASTSETGLAGPVAFGAGLLLLGVAPVIRGGNRHVALVFLEGLGLIVLLAMLMAQLGARKGLSTSAVQWPSGAMTGIWILALAPLWVGLTQLLPLPAGLWAALPGHAPYIEALAVAQAPEVAFRPISLTPDVSWVSVLAGIPTGAVFLLAFFCSPGQLHRLARALIAFALVQAVLGLLQMGPLPGLAFGASVGGRPVGSFANPNHFASYIAMTVPLAILMLRQATASAYRRASGQPGRPYLGILWGVALFMLLAAVLASGSRGGALTALVVTLLAVLLPLRSRQRSDRRWRLAGLAALLVLVAAAVGLDALMSRFESDKAGYLAGDRWQMVTSTWAAAIAFWPTGSGLGSFASVYPAFHPVGVRGFVEHAHNDYVELLMECGLLFVMLAGLAAALVMRQAARLVNRARHGGLDKVALLQASCGLGLLALLMHSWVEFNLRIPANAMLAAFLLGAFLRPLGGSDKGRSGE